MEKEKKEATTPEHKEENVKEATQTKEWQEPERVNPTWMAILKYKGAIEILDPSILD